MRHVEQTKTQFHPSLAWWANEFLGSLSKKFLVKTCVTRLQKSPPSVGDNLGIPHSNNSLQDLQAAPPGSPLLLSNCLLWIPPWGIALTTFHLPELYESCKLHELPKPHNSVSFSSLQSLTPQPGKKTASVRREPLYNGTVLCVNHYPSAWLKGLLALTSKNLIFCQTWKTFRNQ